MGVWKDFLKSLIRHWLQTMLGALVAAGWIQQSDADAWLDPMTATILGGVVFVAVYLWSARDNIKSWVFGKFARLAPANTPPQEIKTEVNALSVMEQFKEARTAVPPKQEPHAN